MKVRITIPSREIMVFLSPAGASWQRYKDWRGDGPIDIFGVQVESSEHAKLFLAAIEKELRASLPDMTLDVELEDAPEIPSDPIERYMKSSLGK